VETTRGRMRCMIFWANSFVLRPVGIGVEQRPVVVLVAQRPGCAEFGDGRSWRDDSPNLLTNQAKYAGICGQRGAGKAVPEGSAEVERPKGTRAGAFHDVEVDHGGLCGWKEIDEC
jgi:hypothetical protein